MDLGEFQIPGNSDPNQKTSHLSLDIGGSLFFFFFRYFILAHVFDFPQISYICYMPLWTCPKKFSTIELK